MAKERLDDLLVKRGLAKDLSDAAKKILAGEVMVGDLCSDKVGALVSDQAVIRLQEKARFVGRGGEKLSAALDHFKITVKDKIAVDVGASTGGFTDCLLQAGASLVYAIDVGTNQLDWKLRNDPRVRSFEKLNARNLDSLPVGTFEPKPTFAVIDVSFISATLVIPPLFKILNAPSEILILVRPQFEVGRDEVEPGGVVSDEQLQEAAWRKVETFAVGLGCVSNGIVASSLKGAKKSNQEYFLYLKIN